MNSTIATKKLIKDILKKKKFKAGKFVVNYFIDFIYHFYFYK